MKLSCIFGFHNYEPIKTFNFIDTSYGCKIPCCSITYLCKNCHTIKVKTIKWTHVKLSVSDLNNGLK